MLHWVVRGEIEIFVCVSFFPEDVDLDKKKQIGLKNLL